MPKVRCSSRNAFSRRTYIASAAALISLSSAAGAQLPASSQQGPHVLSSAEKTRVDDIVHRMTLEEKLAYIGGTGFSVRAMPSLHLPELMMSDGPYGVRSNSGLQSTTYASGIGLAASWDRALAAKVVKALVAMDVRAVCTTS